MVPAFRYHVLTLVGVFLALGVGMVIGSSTLQGAIIDSLTRQLRDLNVKFAGEVAPLRQENRRILDAVGSLRKDLLSTLKLHGTGAIVRTGDYPDAARDVQDVLVAAGLQVASTTTVPPDFTVQSSLHLREAIEALRRDHPSLPIEHASIFRVLAQALVQGRAADDLAPLKAARLIEPEGDYEAACDYVVVVGGGRDDLDSRAETVDLPLVRQLKDLSATVIYVEPKDAAQSSIKVVTPDATATVEDIDTDIGRMGLALALKRGQANGPRDTTRPAVPALR